MIPNEKNMKKYFSYDPESGFELHATAEEAKNYAEKNLEFERDVAVEGWSDYVDQICWGELRQHTIVTMSRPRTEEDTFVSPACDTIIEYGLVDVETIL